MRFIYFIIPLLVILSIVLPACIKKDALKEKECSIPDQVCDKGLLVIENKTQDTVKFKTGESTTASPYQKLKPGEIFRFETSSVEVRFDNDCTPRKSMTSIETVVTPWQYYSVKMDRCEKHVSFYKSSNTTTEMKIEN